ncbi:GTPase domain-containing protein [Holophaga foetida]|uniref:GTPase domain-containing protein n=1 Tax=Holophaga foetida TaxID=35839 RepID=UPI0002471C45|nr:GTPase domain-containing protein [Holophaga foetida]
MSMHESGWEESALQTLREAVGNAAVEVVEAEWQVLTVVDRPRVTLFGSYDSGKSSLLKRLLVEGGVGVPDWLTVSARRETFESREIDALGCRFCDTPGISGGNPEHELLAREAVTLTDVILLVLPPQLLTGDRESILSVLNGQAFAGRGLAMTEAVIPVVAKLDEGSVDPSEDPEGYAEFLKRKKSEWGDFLQRVGLSPKGFEPFLVVADPFQRVQNQLSPRPEDYGTAYRTWDGIEALVTALLGLPTRLEALRTAARKRYLSSKLERLRDEALARQTDLALGLATASADYERHALSFEQLDTLEQAARASLDACLEEEILAAAKAQPENAKQAVRHLTEKLDPAVSRWWDEHTARVGKLAEDIQAAYLARARSESASHAQGLFDEDPAPKRGQRFGKPKVAQAAGQILGKTRTLLREFQEERLGITMKKAREELQAMKQAGNFKTYQKTAGRQGFKTLSEAKSAEGALKIEIASNVVAAIVELGSMIYDLVEQDRIDQNRLDRRATLRTALDQEAGRIAQETWNEWEPNIETLREWIELHRAATEKVQAVLQEQLNLTIATLGRLDCLLS